MSALDICCSLGVSRSVVYKGLNNGNSDRRSYNKAGDEELLPVICEILRERPSYGYRRIHILVNKRLSERINHKRIYRIMKQNNLLLPRYSGKRMERIHDGKIITLHSNTRWCSDGFEIPCFNGEKVRVAFSLDCCDREAMSFVATTGGITADMICDLMLQAVEYRFGRVTELPQSIEWLTDNGSCYLSNKTRGFAGELGFIVCRTPVSSPQSNGMAEAFVKTFKRDYVYVNDRPDAATVMAKLPEWFGDYNENHPHKGLKMMSPREYIKAKHQ